MAISSTAVRTRYVIDAPSQSITSSSHDKQCFRLSPRCMIAFSLKIVETVATMARVGAPLTNSCGRRIEEQG